MPVAVLKAFVKIGLTLMPAEEMANFSRALDWIKEPDHRVGLVKDFPIIYTFQPGPMPNDLLVAFLLRRNIAVSGVPYAFLVLAYGNEVYQVSLPSPERDAAISGRQLAPRAFPAPGHPEPEKYGSPRTGILDLTGRDPVKGEVCELRVGFEGIRGSRVTPDATAQGNVT